MFLTLIPLNAEEVKEIDFVLGFWPEYDRQEALVMVQINMPEKNLPFNAELSIPMGVDTVYVLEKSQGNPSLNPNFTHKKKSWSILMNESNYYMQFYQPIKINNFSRQFDFTLKLDVTLNQYHLVIQEPLQADAFSSNLQNPETVTDEFGLKYHRSHYRDYLANEEIVYQFSYSRNTTIPTLNLLEQIMAEHSNFIQPENVELPNENNLKQKFDMSIKVGIIFSFLTIGCISLFYFFYGDRMKTNYINNGYCPFCGIQRVTVDNQYYCANCGEKLNVS